MHTLRKPRRSPRLARSRQTLRSVILISAIITHRSPQKPEIKASTLDKGNNKAPIDVSSRPESSWDITAQLVLPAPNKDIGLTTQHPELQAVLRDTMLIIKIFMLFMEAYPLMATRAGFGRPRMVEAAEARPTAVHILKRLLTDPSFGAILAPIVSRKLT